MRLSIAMFFKKGPNGSIHTGKTRLVRPVDSKSLANLRLSYEIEEQNMLWLRHPYLTMEQSRGHMKAMGKVAAWKEGWKELRIKKFQKNTLLEDRLMHLKVKDAWD